MFHLRVQKVEHTCLFELSWGQGKRLSKTLRFPDWLTTLYQEWQHAYLSCYNTLDIPHNCTPQTKDSLRGKATGSGTIASHQTDWQRKLVEAETRLSYEFHRWLRNDELFEIHDTIAEASRAAGESGSFIDLFLTCTPIELARLPWEAWEIRSESATGGKIRIVRVPANIRHESASSQVKQQRSRPRILVILGNDEKLDFQEDWKALKQSLNRLADIPEPIGWKSGTSIDELKTEISQALTDAQGWDVLFFAGHSNETQMTGGELGIAPNVSIRISEIAPQLAIAREKGLQFTLFNSCSGLSVAESLIDLGLDQVAVMREPVHNRVAQEFLIQFLKALASHKDVHESLMAACQYLKTEKNLTYPSAHLVPSLFRYPGSKLFQIELPPPSWQQCFWQIIQILFQRYQAAALLVLLLASWQLSVQQWLLERRVLTQAIYRQATLRTRIDKPAPIVLVEIDEQSLEKEARIRPIPRTYLAKLVDRLTEAKVIGVDYLLYPPTDDDSRLAQSVENAAKRGTLFVFGASQDRNTGEWRQAPDTIANPERSLSGSMTVRGIQYAELVSASNQIQPLSYLLASLYQHCIVSSNTIDQSSCSLKSAQLNSLSSPFPFPRSRPKFINYLGYSLRQMWFHPIVDYSLPPDQIYTSISAKDLLEQSNSNILELSQKIIVIVPNYVNAGIDKEGEDNFPAPAAIQHWHNNPHQVLTGGKYHAYLLQHFLTQRLVIPLPDLWMILLAALLASGTVYLYQNQILQRQTGIILLLVGTVVYSSVSLELYLSPVAILLPIASPIVMFWIYVLPPLLQRKL
jgi:CHASE2 domain-containing sensor protein